MRHDRPPSLPLLSARLTSEGALSYAKAVTLARGVLLRHAGPRLTVIMYA